MPILRMLSGELELFERSLLGPDAVRYLWMNAYSQIGVIFTVGELELLIAKVGSASAWDWIRLRREFDEELWTQICGRAADGLVVEINGPCLIAKAGAPRQPRVEVGTSTWSYEAAVPELHSVAEAAARMFHWLDQGSLMSGDERRLAYPRAARNS